MGHGHQSLGEVAPGVPDPECMPDPPKIRVVVRTRPINGRVRLMTCELVLSCLCLLSLLHIFCMGVLYDSVKQNWSVLQLQTV